MSSRAGRICNYLEINSIIMRTSLFATILLTLLTLTVKAQAPASVAGKWSSCTTNMGVTSNNVMEFDGDTSGHCHLESHVTLAISAMGIEVSGESIITDEGTFEYKDGRLVLRWDAEKITCEFLKPIACTKGGKPDEKTRREVESIFDTTINRFREKAGTPVVYDPVEIKKGNLQITTRDEKGRKKTFTYAPLR